MKSNWSLISFLPVSHPFHELRSALGKNLPNYMIPSVFIPMDAFPLTPNGKIDKKSPASSRNCRH